MSLRNSNARQIIGTQAFVSACKDVTSDPYRWVWDSPRTLHERGVVISAATVLQVLLQIKLLEDSDHRSDRAQGRLLRNHFDISYERFKSNGCVIPILADHVEFAARIPGEIKYHNSFGLSREINMLERLVIATAIKGLHQRGLDLLDYAQDQAFARLAAEYSGLKIGTWTRLCDAEAGTG